MTAGYTDDEERLRMRIAAELMPVRHCTDCLSMADAITQAYAGGLPDDQLVAVYVVTGEDVRTQWFACEKHSITTEGINDGEKIRHREPIAAFFRRVFDSAGGAWPSPIDADADAG